MKFGDKLTLLRKRNGLSQEDLGEKLNVTRQTVSKWELGQTKPDTDKLMEISKLLNVDFNLLIDDTLPLDSINNNSNTNNNTTSSNVVIDDEVRPRKWLLLVLIIIAIGIVIFLLNGYVTNKKAKEEAIKDEFSNILDFVTGNNDTNTDVIDNANSKAEEMISQFEIRSFNSKYETFYAGTVDGSSINDMLDDIITNNKTNKERTIRVIYGNINTIDETEIRNLKKSFGDVWTDYEVILDYDDIGFVDQITIEN